MAILFCLYATLYDTHTEKCCTAAIFHKQGIKMKFDFHIRPAAEIPAAEALRLHQATEMTGADRGTCSQPALGSGLSLLVRRQVRLARRSTR